MQAYIRQVRYNVSQRGHGKAHSNPAVHKTERKDPNVMNLDMKRRLLSLSVATAMLMSVAQPVVYAAEQPADFSGIGLKNIEHHNLVNGNIISLHKI